jgi:hypothetical protein
MKLGSLPRGLAVAAIAAVTVVPLAASSASAAPVAPTAYALFGSAQPLVWGTASSFPPAVGDMRVPFVWGKTNNVAVANSNSVLAVPDAAANTKPLSGESISGLSCKGYDEKLCKDPFTPKANVTHGNGVNPGHFEETASWGGKDGKFPGEVSAVTDCSGNCGDNLVRSVSNALGTGGGYAGYISIGSSSAGHNLSIDDKGRLISTATSQLDNVSIGPKNEVHFSRLTTSAQAFGTGADNTKDGRADLRISDFYILDNPVELTPAGLRLANGGPSDQEAYDGAKALLNRLKKERGITLELPRFDTQIAKTADHATVEVQGLRVWFDQAVAALNYPLDLGHSTAVVVALNTDRKVDVSSDPSGGRPTVQNTAPTTAAPAPPPSPDRGGATVPPGTRGNGKESGTTKTTAAPVGGRGSSNTGTQGSASAQAPPANGDVQIPPPVPVDGAPATATDATQTPGNSDNVALGIPDVADKLGLRGAHAVSRAFGAVFGLGLILPLARFVIRRLGEESFWNRFRVPLPTGGSSRLSSRRSSRKRCSAAGGPSWPGS